MEEKKENFEFVEKINFEEKAKKIRQLKFSSYFFEFFINITVFLRLREKTKKIIETKQNKVFYSTKLDITLPELTKKVIERYSESDSIDLDKNNYLIRKISGEKDILYDITKSFISNLTIEKFIEFENRYTLLYFFTEFENYLFKCFKYTLTKRPDIINDTKVSLKEIKEANGNIKNIIDNKAEIEAYSKFDLELFIDDVIEKKIHNKFYKNYTEIFYYAEKVLGIKLSLPKETIDILNLFKQVRNLYTHGDGTINQIFLKRIEQISKKGKKYRLGEKFQLTDQFIKDLIFIFKTVIGRFDYSIITLFPDLIYK